MTEQVRILLPTQVVGVEEIVDYRAIWMELNRYMQGHKDSLNLDILDGWRLLFSILSIPALPSDKIAVLKRIRRYPSDKEFEVALYIPIPCDNEAPYGMASVRGSIMAPPVDEKKFYSITPDYGAYTTLHDYVLESGKRALHLAFTAGLTINGVKLKLHD